jgi:hypothetical protein
VNNYLSGLSDAKVNALLAMAGKKLGKSPEDLKSQLQSGSLDALLAGMSGEQKAKIAGMLGNPAALEALMQNEQVRKILGGR